MQRYDAVVVGSGPNGLAAAITLAQAGRSVLVVEAADRIGGGTRTQELIAPGFVHDVCSAIHPFGIGSPFLRSLPLAEHGLDWVQPAVPLAHAVTPEEAALLPRDLDEATEALGSEYGRAMRWITSNWPRLDDHLFGPLLRFPGHPVTSTRFGLRAMRSAERAVRQMPPATAALFAGCAAHAFLPLSSPLSAAFGWFLMAGAHRYGWPAAKGGSQSIADALGSYLTSLGGDIETGWRVEDLDELPTHEITMLDISPEGLATIAGKRLPSGYLRRVRRFRRAPAAYKVDYALDGPAPWANPDLAGAGTVHLAGTADDVAEAERAAFEGWFHPRPFVLVAQQSMFDPTRAPAGKHTLWTYAHVPHGSAADHSESIEALLEEYAPGFSERIIGRKVWTPADLENHNPNLVGGDITGGAHTMSQLVFRPFLQRNPYATPLQGVYLCSASTPPGAGAHGMCGYHAARAALAGD